MTAAGAGRRPRGAASALGLLTVLGGASPPTPGALVWFAPVGVLVGGLVGLSWWGATRWWPLLLAATLAVALDLALTGLLHLDGLADAADGLLPHLDRDRRLAVMAAPDVGAFAVGTVVVTLALRTAAVAALPHGWRAAAFAAGTWAAARALMAATIAVARPARPGGMAAGFAPAATRVLLAVLVVAVPLATAGAVVGRGAAGAVSLALGLLAGLGVVALAVRRLGGYTGDVLGASCVLTETVTLVAAAARW